MDERDSIKATPQSPVMGLFAGGLQGLDGLLNRSGIEGLSGALGVPAAARLFENMSYGSPPYSGTGICLLYTSPSPRDRQKSRMPSSA